MSISDYTVRMMLLFLPGIIAFIIVDNLTTHKKTQMHHWIIYSFLLGFISYACWLTFCNFLRCAFDANIKASFLLCLTNVNLPIDFYEIRNTSFIAVLLGLLFVKARTDRWLFRFAKKFKISNKFPEIDAWDNCLALYSPAWIRVRDVSNNRCYQGRLVSSSDANDRDGLILQEVSVYTEQGVLLYEAPVIYIPRPMDSLIIELL